MTKDKPRIARRLARGVDFLAHPPPYRAWLALSNDPDCTTWERWQELHDLIWQRLRLPFADSFFLFSYNDAIPGQVTVSDHPEILAAHPHDTMHTWGDYTMSRSRPFHRDEAAAGLSLLREHGLEPRVWTDHARFPGNLLHHASGGCQPYLEDASGNYYENFVYTLDLIHRAGVRYLWDGSDDTQVLGQDRKITRREWYSAGHGDGLKSSLIALAEVAAGPLLTRLRSSLPTYRPDINRQYFRHTFPDDQTFYLFRRYVQWSLADIDGFGEAIGPRVIDRLIGCGGSCIVYTHLGKQRAKRAPCSGHVPPATRTALEHVAERHAERHLMVSSTSGLLDYLVLRDHAELRDGRLNFRSDGLRFRQLAESDLAGLEFGLRVSEDFSAPVTCEGREVAHDLQEVAPGTLHLTFPPVKGAA